MQISGRGAQPTGGRDRVQAASHLGRDTSDLRFRAAGCCAALGVLLSGCASFPSSVNPVSWWHDLQGGAIAEQRPPAPGADQPYPNLATVPPKPDEPDRAALQTIADGLIDDRANAQHQAAEAPLADPSSPSASPTLFGKGTAPPPLAGAPPGQETASATIPAASAPPPTNAPAPSPSPSGTSAAAVPAPSKAPVGAVNSVPLAPPGAAVSPGAEAAQPPPIPTTPPPPPNLPGAARSSPPPPAAPPQMATAAQPPEAPAPEASPPSKAQPAPAASASLTTPEAGPTANPTAPATTTAGPAAPMPTNPAIPADTISVSFVNGSAALPSASATTLKQLAARRGNGIIAVTGYGEAASNSPDAQSAALSLGLSRAQAIAAALTSAGVPTTSVQVDAQAIGRGGTARLVQ